MSMPESPLIDYVLHPIGVVKPDETQAITKESMAVQETLKSREEGKVR
jgi:hypothetical protein